MLPAQWCGCQAPACSAPTITRSTELQCSAWRAVLKFWDRQRFNHTTQLGPPRVPPGSPRPSPTTMAAPLSNRSPTCLACLRRLAQPFGNRNGSASAVSLVQMQVRTKKTSRRLKDQGVAVRLLEDIPKYGRKGRPGHSLPHGFCSAARPIQANKTRPDSIFRVERGRMRNEWFPHNKAEYMTALRLRELGLTRGDIGERDTAFGTVAEVEDVGEPEALTATVITTSVRRPTSLPFYLTMCGANDAYPQPEKAHTLLSTNVPETLVFFRKPIPAPAPPPPARSVSPLISSANADATHDRNTPLAIYGSVSATDVVGHIKGLLADDPHGSRIVLGPEHIRFLGLTDDADRIKALGRWEVEISSGGTGLEPVRKVVEILPLEIGEAGEGEAQSAS